MVAIQHVGFGARERQVWLYWWDTRDGADWSGWWMTTDFIGNNEFLLQCMSDVDHPTAAPAGSWRSPNVEELQLKRRLSLGFEAVAGETGCIRACGADAATPFVPDQTVTVDLSQWIFRPEGLNHGRVAFLAAEKPADMAPPTDAKPHGSGWGGIISKEAAYGFIGVLAGVTCTVVLTAMMNRRAMAR